MLPRLDLPLLQLYMTIRKVFIEPDHTETKREQDLVLRKHLLDI